MPNKLVPNYHTRTPKLKFNAFFKELDKFEEGYFDEAEFALRVNAIFAGVEFNRLNKTFKKYESRRTKRKT